MPGSKRRALKQLLSPSHSPSQSNPPAPVQSPPPMSIESSTSLSSLPSADNGGMTSTTSISSNPNNYLSDEALEQDLALEEMASRQNSIGSGHHREEDGVPDLSSLNPGNGGTNGHRSSFSSLPPPPPPKQAAAPTQVTADQLAYGKEDSGGFGFKGKKKSSKQRFAERQARRQEALLHSAPPNDPAWNAQLEKERQEEIKVITDACAAMGAELHEIPPDGHCMFNAIGDQLAQLGLVSADEASNPRHTRKMAAQYMLAHPDDFMPFLPSITGEDSAGATDDGMMTPEQFQKYCSLVAETGEWGGEPEIQALSRAFKIPIHVFQRGPPTVVSHGGPDDTFGGGLTPQQSIQQGDRVVRISYHKRMYGLGEHYNSLRKAVK